MLLVRISDSFPPDGDDHSDQSSGLNLGYLGAFALLAALVVGPIVGPRIRDCIQEKMHGAPAPSCKVKIFRLNY